MGSLGWRAGGGRRRKEKQGESRRRKEHEGGKRRKEKAREGRRRQEEGGGGRRRQYDLGILSHWPRPPCHRDCPQVSFSWGHSEVPMTPP